jgi:pimeloyl-ACP methyl ester carboxylesterase
MRAMRLTTNFLLEVLSSSVPQGTAAMVWQMSRSALKHPGKTPSFRGAGGHTLAGSIAEVGYLRLGGLNQWVLIRGESVTNPPLIVLHGGPGFPEVRLSRHFNAPLEKSYTVVYWEQRGSGKSFNRKIPKSSMTIESFIADLDELVDIIRKRFKKDRIAIYGHCWGSALGVLYASRFPEKVAAYVGTAQIGDCPASELLSYAFVLAEAERRNNRKALRELHAIGTPPYSSRAILVQRKWLLRFTGIARGMSLWNLARIMLGGPEASIFDLPNVVRGLLFSADTMWTDVAALNLVKAVPELQIPIFFFIGRHDHLIAPQTSTAYFDMLTAPSKKLVWFEDSGHEPDVEEPAKFNAAMIELVRPIVVRSLQHPPLSD